MLCFFKKIVSYSVYTKVSISDDPEDQSYEFQKLLLGKEYLIQDAQTDDLTGEYVQYIGVTLRDENGNADGVVFAVDKESGKFVYYPNEKIIGRKATSYGLRKAQLTDEYAGYLTLGEQSYFASSLETGSNYIYAAVPAKSVGGNRLPLTIASGIMSAVALFVVFILLTFTRKRTKAEEDTKETKKLNRPNVDVIMPNKQVKKALSAASRWGNEVIAWTDKTPEQQIFTVLKALMGFLAVIICAAVLMKDTFFDENSIFQYVLSGCITACLCSALIPPRCWHQPES